MWFQIFGTLVMPMILPHFLAPICLVIGLGQAWEVCQWNTKKIVWYKPYKPIALRKKQKKAILMVLVLHLLLQIKFGVLWPCIHNTATMIPLILTCHFLTLEHERTIHVKNVRMCCILFSRIRLEYVHAPIAFTTRMPKSLTHRASLYSSVGKSKHRLDHVLFNIIGPEHVHTPINSFHNAFAKTAFTLSAVVTFTTHQM